MIDEVEMADNPQINNTNDHPPGNTGATLFLERWGKESEDLLKHLEKVQLQHMQWRTQFIYYKIIFVGALLGIGSINLPFQDGGKTWVFAFSLYIVPFIAAAYDLFIFGEDFKIRRIGVYFNFSGGPRQVWENFVSKHRETSAFYYGSFFLSVFTLIPGTLVSFHPTLTSREGVMTNVKWFAALWFTFALSTIVAVFCHAMRRHETLTGGYDLPWCRKLEDVLHRKPKIQASELKMLEFADKIEKDIPSDDSTSLGERLFLYGLIRALQSNVVVETGTHYGKTALYMAHALRDNGKGHLHTADPLEWGAQDNFRRFPELGCRITYHKNKGYELEVTDIDLLFIDSFHEKPEVLTEIRALFPKLKEHAVVVFHDCSLHTHEHMDVNGAIAEAGLRTIWLPTQNRLRIYEHGST